MAIKECPFSGVTKSGRVWRRVPESDARSVLGVCTDGSGGGCGATRRLSTCACAGASSVT